MTKIETQTLGYPRIGKDRETKKALAAYWRGNLSSEELLKTIREVEEAGWNSQLEAGIDRIGIGDITKYDHVLDWTYRFGLIPERFKDLEGLDLYFTMARGAPGVPALELTKWFDTNYHYLVPEIEPGLKPAANFEDFLDSVKRAQRVLGDRAVPIIVGPITLLRLARLEQPFDETLDALLPVYQDLLKQLSDLGIGEAQLHEPGLVLGGAEKFKEATEKSYAALSGNGVDINLVTYFDDLGNEYDWIVALPVEVISLDFTRGRSLDLLKEKGWPEGVTLAAGVVDGRSVWQVKPAAVESWLEEAGEAAPLRVSASSSLQFVPYEAARETHLQAPLRTVLSFAEEKLVEIAALGKAASGEPENGWAKKLEDDWLAFRDFAPDHPEVQEKLNGLTEADFTRQVPYQERRESQIKLPLFPTTTIGSFPQTTEIRGLRGRFKRGEINQETYDAGVDSWIAYTIGTQEGMGLDVLVHGEFERSDMVEYFAEKMDGFAFTNNGWVQSYGHRYVRPPIIYADVYRPEAMTTREFAKAQSFTEKPVKGMLTGPVTILNWSYPRTDISRRDIAFQIALALRDEINDLEAVGARMVQVDEPALREGLPLKPKRWDEYLSWAIDAFRLSTASANPETQVHTHMCYSEFGDVLEAIDGLNADVISIENARSDDETLRELADYGYGRQVGPGVYDVHSPVVPEKEFIKDKLRAYLQHLEAEQIWVNPDCGLKTRGWAEVIPALNHIVEAVDELREEVETQEKVPA